MLLKDNIIDSFQSIKVLIVGDVMIDSYIWGKVDRISPEAPVPIVNVSKREQRLGGAANVALNIQSLGATPFLCSVIGNDPDGASFLQLMQTQNLSTEGILKSDQRITTIKHRIISGSQHILRVDQEIDSNISEGESADLILKVLELIQKEKINIVIFEDYDKGVLCQKVIQEIIKYCASINIPTIVDPKKRNFLAYSGAGLFKPNLKELKEGLKVEIDPKNIGDIERYSKELCEKMSFKCVFVTLSDNGVFITDKINSYHIKAHPREISDVSGAGDTVVSVAALCLASKLELNQIAEISNIAGGIVCEKVGVVPIVIEELTNECRKLGIIS